MEGPRRHAAFWEQSSKRYLGRMWLRRVRRLAAVRLGYRWEAGDNRARLHVRGDGAGGACAARCFLGPELRSGSRADVGLPVAGARHLCGLVGTDQSGADGDDYVGSTEGGWQQGEVVGGGTEGADTASCFPGSEPHVGSQADVAREVAMTGDGDSGGVMVSDRQQGGVVHGGNLGEVKAASCFPGPELRVESRAGGGQSAVGTRQLCGPAGTDQLRNNGRKAKMKKTSKRVGSRGAGAAEAVGSRADVGRLGSRFGVLQCDGEAGGDAPSVMEKAASGGGYWGGMWWAGMPVDTKCSQRRAIQNALNEQ